MTETIGRLTVKVGLGEVGVGEEDEAGELDGGVGVGAVGGRGQEHPVDLLHAVVPGEIQRGLRRRLVGEHLVDHLQGRHGQ